MQRITSMVIGVPGIQGPAIEELGNTTDWTDDGKFQLAAGPLAGSYIDIAGLPGPAYGAVCNHPDNSVPHELWDGGRTTTNSGPQFWGAVFDAGGVGTVANMVVRGLLAGGTLAAPTAAPSGASALDVHADAYDGAAWYTLANIEFRSLGQPSPTNYGSQMIFRTQRLDATGVDPEGMVLWGDMLSIGEGRSSQTALTAAGYILHLNNQGVTASQLGLWSKGSVGIVSGDRLGGIDWLSRDTSFSAPYPVTASIRAIAEATHTASEYSTALAFCTGGGASLTEWVRLKATGVLSVTGGLTIGSLGGVLKASSGVVSGSATTTDLTEGSNLYFTNARARGAVSATSPLSYDSGTGVFSLPAFDHGYLSGLTDDDHTIYALLAGRSGGQTLVGGTASGDDLTLSSSAHGTKGDIILGTSRYDEVNNRLGIGGAAVSPLTVPTAPAGSANIGLVSLGAGPFDGSTSGFFTGSASGTHLAINAASGYTGNFWHAQLAGVDRAYMASTGEWRWNRGALSGNEILLRARVTDASGDEFLIINGTGTDSRFAPRIVGLGFTNNNTSPLTLVGESDVAQDVGVIPILTLIGRQRTGDPVSGSATASIARPPISFDNHGTRMGTFWPDGSLVLSTLTTAIANQRLTVIPAVNSDLGLVVRGISGQTGVLVKLQGRSSTTDGRDMAVLDAVWATSTDASRKGRFLLYASDATTNREVIRGESDGSTGMLGFFGATAVVRAAAYTQTYSTATRTQENLTSATLTDNTAGSANTTCQALPDPADTPADADALRDDLVANLIPAIRNNFADLIAQVNALRVDLVNVKGVTNSLIDDEQGYGLAT